ncbi:MAG TPA: hypothetical protein PK413_00665 [Thermoanaerobaculia bacterium]|nr:hypothetical protein [Thermoanaerobaculia bacterium]
MIDLHCHILPGIDDGARDFDEAVAMCRLAAQRGCEAMVATPHQFHAHWANDEPAVLERLLARLQERVGPQPRLYLGAEIRVYTGLLEELERWPASSALPLAGSRYLLVEFDRRGYGPEPRELIHELVVAGWQPIIAHPEHYPWLMENLDLVEELMARGALCQITGMSLAGGFGRNAQLACRELVDRGWVHFVASDAHGVSSRPPGLAEAYRLLEADAGALA